MRRPTRTVQRTNDFSSPVPASFAVEQPTQDELQLREDTADARGVRPIQSPWPSQPPRVPMTGRGVDNTLLTRGSRNRAGAVPQGAVPQGAVQLRMRGQTVDSTAPPRSAPLIFSLPTQAEHRATLQARDQERRKMRRDRREDERNARRNANTYRLSSNTNNDYARIISEPTGVNGHTTDAHGVPDNRGIIQPSQVSPPPPPPPQEIQYPIINQNDWRVRPEVHVRVYDMPLQFTTLDVYNRFEQYGVVEAVELYENTNGTKNGEGRVKFSRVHGPFWHENVTYTWHGSLCRLRVQLSNLPKDRFKVTSPANKAIEYPDRFIFKPQKLDFGIMIEPNLMLSMYTTKDEEEITFEVNLFRKQVDVIFKIFLTKGDDDTGASRSSSIEIEQQNEAEKQEREQAKGRWETYRFQIPFSRLEKILEQGPVMSKTNRAFLIPLPSPPLFWRELCDVATSHDLNAKYWASWDKWFRQTGIAYDPVDRSESPISLGQRKPIIDTGRWTTYRFHFGLESNQVDRFERMLSALRDFNVKTETLDELRITTERRTPIWDMIDVKSTNMISGGLSEALRPLLPFPTRYQLEVCISQNILNEYNITIEFIDKLTQLGPANAVRLLEFVAEKKTERFYNPMDIFKLTGVTGGTAAALLKRAASDCQLVRGASITPSTVIYTTPVVETTNRVIRHYRQYSDRFLRVQFVDEFKDRINSTNKNAMNEVFTRIMTAMVYGITIGGRHFEFLAFGNSQIREHGAYFFASDDHTSADDIRAWMGEFKDIKIVAKHAARLGQCFSTTRAIRGVQVDVVKIADITYSDNEYQFSDGVGKISEFLARVISAELELPQKETPPSCFQFRLGGCKGVLAVWPDAIQREVYIRPSQQKFTAMHNTLEVIRCSSPASASLNRQLIIVLSSLGASDDVFILKLTDMLKKFQDAMVSPAAALSLLCKTIDPNQFTLELAAMVRDKFMESQDPFVISLLSLWRAWAIKYLKEKAKITIEDGAFVLGVVDETGILKGHYDNNDKDGSPARPEIFLQISDTENPGKTKVIEGLCIIARNPSLHPGDIRTVYAVNVPELHHLRDVVVFPNHGDRDLASMLSGGDLDGDDYIVIWDHDLTYGITDHKPMDYSPMEPFRLNRDVEVKDITKFFVNYMRNDKLGAIANSHLAWADFLDDGVKSDQCFRLASLHSDAVDYVKTGVPADMPRELRLRKYPHFMEKEPERTYKSCKILGKLYDLVEKIDFVPAYELQFDERILNACTLSNDLLAEARKVKSEYDAALHSIMAQHEIHTEFEVYSTFVMHHSKASKDYKFHEEIGHIRSSLKDTWRKIVTKIVRDSEEAKLEPFVAAMYTVTKQELDTALEDLKTKKAKGKKRERYVEGTPLKFTLKDVEEMPLISFPWLFPEILGKLANREYPFTIIDNAPEGSTQVDPDDHDITAADDLAGFEIVPVEEYLEDGSKAYIHFDYNKQGEQSDGGMIGIGINANENHSHTSDSDGNSGDGTIHMEQGGTNAKEDINGCYASRMGDGIDDDDGENFFPFCEQLFVEARRQGV